VSWLDRLRISQRRRHQQPLELSGLGPEARMQSASGPEPGLDSEPAVEQRSPAETPSTAPSSFFPRFESSASDQPMSAHRGRSARAKLMLRNAYTPSQPITDRGMFAGRTEVLATIIRAVEDQRLHVVVYGERGIGKTSILQVLAEAARAAHYLTIYMPCGANATFDEIFRAVAGQIPLLFDSGYGPTADEVEQGQTLASLLPLDPISPRMASDLLARLVDTRVLVLLDEFDRCEQEEFRLKVAELIKDLSDRSVRVQLVIAGVAANLTELITHIPSIQRNILALPTPKMTEPEVIELVRGGEDVAGLKFDQAAIDLIVAAANGFPYLASLLSHHAAFAVLDEDRLNVTTGDVSSAIAKALREFRGRISIRSQKHIQACVDEGAHRVFGALAGAGQLTGGRFDKDDIRAVQANSSADCQALVERFASEGVLITAIADEFGRHYAFIEESVGAYLWLLSTQDRARDKPAIGAELSASALRAPARQAP
jgi:Cdc6-like AAA superfamily ATPase